jgi:hypothetical protein
MARDDEKSGTHFLNVDLDVSTHEGLDDLVSFFCKHTVVLRCEQGEASFETLKEFDSIHDNLMEFLRIISLMDEATRQLWEQCHYRGFNIGIMAEFPSAAMTFEISAVTMTEIRSSGCILAVTIYSAKE